MLKYYDKTDQLYSIRGSSWKGRRERSFTYRFTWPRYILAEVVVKVHVLAWSADFVQVFRLLGLPESYPMAERLPSIPGRVTEIAYAAV